MIFFGLFTGQEVYSLLGPSSGVCLMYIAIFIHKRALHTRVEYTTTLWSATRPKEAQGESSTLSHKLTTSQPSKYPAVPP